MGNACIFKTTAPVTAPTLISLPAGYLSFLFLKSAALILASKRELVFILQGRQTLYRASLMSFYVTKNRNFMGVKLNNLISSNLFTQIKEFVSSEQRLSWTGHESG